MTSSIPIVAVAKMMNETKKRESYNYSDIYDYTYRTNMIEEKKALPETLTANECQKECDTQSLIVALFIIYIVLTIWCLFLLVSRWQKLHALVVLITVLGLLGLIPYGPIIPIILIYINSNMSQDYAHTNIMSFSKQREVRSSPSRFQPSAPVYNPSTPPSFSSPPSLSKRLSKTRLE